MNIKDEKKIKNVEFSEKKSQQGSRQEHSAASFSIAEKMFILSMREKISNYN